MAEHRNAQRALQPSDGATPVAEETLRSAALAGSEQAGLTKGEERISAFWRIFGATFLSIAALVILTLCQHFNNCLNDLRGELGHLNEDLRKELSRLNEAHAEFLKKEEFSFRMKSVWDAMKELREGLASTAGLKERTVLAEQRLKIEEEEQKQLAREIGRLREVSASKDARAEMVRELQRLRERLAAVEGRQAVAPIDKPTTDLTP